MPHAIDGSEAAEYYFTYIDQAHVATGRDICDALATQLDETRRLLTGVSEAGAEHRYAPEKWSVKQVVGHINDTERVFAHRALWFARALTPELPGFDEGPAAATAGADERPWASHVEEFVAVRNASLALFRNLPREAWARRGVASGNTFTVRALAYIVAGHVAHHVAILRERYRLG